MRSFRRSARVMVSGLALLGWGCEKGTNPAPAGPPTPTPTASSTTSSAVVSSFGAQPATIDDGDAFDLYWSTSGGAVSLARRGASPFAVGLASEGLLSLSAGKPGYPEGPGTHVYEIVVGDAAARAETAVTVELPEPSLSLSGAKSCHPTPTTPCQVTVTARGSDFDTLQWTGCCTEQSEATGRCTVLGLALYECKVTATGPGGSVTAIHQVQGRNNAPTLSDCTHVNTTGGNYVVSCDVTDEDPVVEPTHTCEATVIGGAIVPDDCEVGDPVRGLYHTVYIPPYMVRIRVTDPWGATGQAEYEWE